jgi:hypothetical protein
MSDGSLNGLFLKIELITIGRIIVAHLCHDVSIIENISSLENDVPMLSFDRASGRSSILSDPYHTL